MKPVSLEDIAYSKSTAVIRRIGLLRNSPELYQWQQQQYQQQHQQQQSYQWQQQQQWQRSSSSSNISLPIGQMTTRTMLVPCTPDACPGSDDVKHEHI